MPTLWTTSCQGSNSDRVLYQSQPPEVQLLLCCARTFINTATAEIIETLCYGDLEWTWLLSLAAQNDVTSLLYQSLQDTCPDVAPAPVMDQLRQDFQTCTLNTLFFTQELLKLLRLFEVHHIPVLPYKGPALAVALYGNLSLRPFCDLDLLIHPQDLIRVKHLLVAEGYDTLAVEDVQEAANLWSDSERDFVRHDGKVVVDLHWRITPRFFPFELSVEKLWEHCQPLCLLSTTVSTLAPEDLLLALCAHGGKECWGKLKWICDVAELIRTYPNLDWNQVLTQAKQLHSQRMLLLGVGLAWQLLGVRLPETVLTAVQKDRAIPMLMQQVCSYLFGSQPGQSRQFSPTQFRLWVRDRPSDQIQYLVWRLFVPNVRDRQLIVLPKPLTFFYYLLRPLRLLGEKLGFIHRRTLGSNHPDGHQPAATVEPDIDWATARPLCKRLDVYDLSDELLIYSSDQELGITLNHSSKQIWQLCDGTHTLEDMATVLSQKLGCPGEALLEDICTTVMQFYNLRLLERL
ncbi:MAG: PqqD family peptide modification chaperone [Stigonema ocellatum SAG 48.90 = DSM 106950]|nr:PqqD family peptide modification chaperone [Stigonema ocellatum SAG 48.90 = DSM 106950]